MQQHAGASTESQIRLRGNRYYWDRGYGGTEGDVNTFARGAGAQLLGTAKRMRSFFWTFDQAPGPNRFAVQEKGTMASYWAVKISAGGFKQYALAHRSGLGRVVLMQTTDEEVGPGRFTLISRRGRDGAHRPAPILLRSFEENVVLLTETQRSPEWFLLRKFRITGTGAFALWKHLAKDIALLEDNCKHDVSTVLKVLGISSEEENEEALEPDPTVYTAPMLAPMTLASLKTICKGKQLPVSGTKTALVTRILGWVFKPPKPERTIVSILLGSWFMAPFRSQACREGTMNEPFILANLPKFLDRSSDLHMELVEEYGLLAAKSKPSAAFSPDGIAVIVSPQLGRFFALVECKSKCVASTETEEIRLAAAFGMFVEVKAVEQCDLFKVVIPNAGYRGQIVHGMACGFLDHALFVVASLSRIIRVVHVRMTEAFREQYMAVISDVDYHALSWVNEGIAPDLDLDESPHAVDQHSVQMTLDLWLAMDAMITERGKPLPAGRHLIPECVAEWNRCKGPIDEYSRFMKNVHSSHAHLGPVAAIWLRLIMTMIYNSFQTFLLSRSQAFLLSDE
jgi:hypothetical protein